MNITIRDIVKIGGLKNAEIVAGIGGIDNIVESISVLEVAESEISRWVLKNQLYITSFYAIHANVEKQKEVIKALHKAKGCGLVLCHVNLWIKSIDKEIIELCNLLNFPLVAARSEVSYVEILNPIIEKLMKINVDDFQMLLSTQNNLIELVANKDELEDIFKNISSLFEHEVMFFDLNNNCIFSKNVSKKDLIVTMENYLKENFNGLNIECTRNGYALRDTENIKRIIYPIKTVGIFYGFIVTIYEESRFEYTITMIENIANICTLIYTKKSRIQEMEEINTQDYISDLITWNFRNEEVALKAGLDIGWDITNKSRVIIVNINSIQENLNNMEVKDIQKYVKKYLYPLIVQEVKYSNPKNLIGFRSDIIFILFDKNNIISDENSSHLLASKILQICDQNIIGSISIGISNNMNAFIDIPNGYREASNAAIMGRNFIGENKIVRYSDLGFLPILKELKSQEKAMDIGKQLLKPLKDYDETNNTEYMDTLKYLLEYDLNTFIVAEKMYLHKNTILYRKNKIIEILNNNPFEMPHKLNYLLAFMINSI